MTGSRQHRRRFSLRTLLGLPGSAPAAQVRSEGGRLLRHIEARLGGVEDEGFAGARRLEMERLGRGLEAESGGGIRRRGLAWGWGVVGFVLGAASAAGWFLLSENDSGPRPGIDLPAELSVLAEPPNSRWSLFHLEDERLLAEHPADGATWSFPSGRYRLWVRNADCPDEWEQQVDLPGGESRRYAPELCRGRGEVVIESDPEEARLQIDGIDLGAAGSTVHRLRPGPHNIRVEKPGFAPWEGKVRVRADERLVVKADLAPSASQDSPHEPGASPAPPARPPRPTAGPALAQARAEAEARAGHEADSGKRRERTGKGGSKSWHDAVKHQLVSDYDRNGSLSLDLAAEILSIPCPVLQNVEASYETGGLAVDMIRLYGFDGSAAPTNTLGVTSSMRGYAFERMKACGLKTRR
ncbi:MAG: PEGA domain-containing protein [Myxococcota bacterium]|nr:PEGA domain-containing protein [Myxococcota bacterium]